MFENAQISRMVGIKQTVRKFLRDCENTYLCAKHGAFTLLFLIFDRKGKEGSLKIVDNLESNSQIRQASFI